MAERPDARRRAARSSSTTAPSAQRFRGPLVHESVRAEQAARRRGTAATKTRGKVSGGGAKPWRQKGTGRARAGSSRSPMWTGGGTVFGPQPRSYTFKVNRKERRAALRSALSLHAERGSLAVLDAGAFDAPKTRQARELLDDWGQPRARRSSCSPPRSRRRAVVPQPRRASRAAGRGRRASPTSSARRRCWSPSRRSSAHRARQRRGAPAGGGEPDGRTPRCIIRPVVSEKSYVLSAADRYTFRVHADAHKTQIRQAVEELFDVHVRRRAHDQRQVQAQAPRRHPRAHARVEEGDRAGAPRARRSRSSRACRRSRSETMPIRKPKPTSPGRRFVSYADFAEVTQVKPEKSLVEGLKKTGGRNAHGRKTARHRGGGAKRPYRRDRLQAPQGRRAGEGRGDRVRPQPLRLHRAAALRRRREALHPRAAAPDGRHDASQSGDGADIAVGNCLPLARHAGRHGRAQRRAAARPRRADGRSAGAGSS